MGKLGIIFAFLLSVAAAGGSYYLYQSWVEARTVQGIIEAKYDQAKEKIITVQSEREKIKAEKDQIAAKSEKYRTQAEAMQAQVGQLQAEQKLADSEKAALANQLEDRQRMITELQKKMEELEQKAKEAQAACGVTPADLKTDPFSAAQPTMNTSASTTTGSGPGIPQLAFRPVTPGGVPSVGTSVAQDVSTKTENSSVGSAATPMATTGPKVLTVNRKFNFVVINQGLQDGFKMGDKLKVLKQGQEVAVVQIEKLYDKFSAATLMSENPRRQVVEGDEIRKA